MCARVPLFGRATVPLYCFDIILRETSSLGVPGPEVILCLRDSLLRSFPESNHIFCFAGVWRTGRRRGRGLRARRRTRNLFCPAGGHWLAQRMGFLRCLYPLL